LRRYEDIKYPSSETGTGQVVANHLTDTSLQEGKSMARRRSDPYIPARRDFNEMFGDLESWFDSVTRDLEAGRPPAVSRGASHTYPGLRTDFRVDILEHDDEVIVVAELPGVAKEDIEVRLLDPKGLLIDAKQRGPGEERPEEYYIRERGEGALRRLVRLPASVTEEGAATSFKNGVLEVRLKKSGAELGADIPLV
jgi:HSP20 family protein